MLSSTRPVAQGATSLVRRFLAERDGATAIEYGFIALGIGLAIAFEVGLALEQVFVAARERLE